MFYLFPEENYSVAQSNTKNIVKEYKANTDEWNTTPYPPTITQPHSYDDNKSNNKKKNKKKKKKKKKIYSRTQLNHWKKPVTHVHKSDCQQHEHRCPNTVKYCHYIKRRLELRNSFKRIVQYTLSHSDDDVDGDADRQVEQSWWYPVHPAVATITDPQLNTFVSTAGTAVVLWS